MASSTASDIFDTFDPFPRLPAELRTKIWGFVVEPRTLEITYEKGNPQEIARRITKRFICDKPPSPLLSVSQEARNEYLTTLGYERAFVVPPFLRCTILNFSLDTLRLSAPVLEYIHDIDLLKIKKLSIQVGDAAYFGHFHMGTIRKMTQLQELDLLSNEVQTRAIYSWHKTGREAMIETLGNQFKGERYTDPGWKCPRVRVVDLDSGDVWRVLEEGGALVEGWTSSDPYPEHLL